MNTEKKATHTPTPEEIAAHLPILIQSGSSNGRPDIQTWLVKHSSEIVHAVNAHQALLDICKRILPYLKDCGYGGSNSTTEKSHIKDLESAITKAEGK